MQLKLLSVYSTNHIIFANEFSSTSSHQIPSFFLKVAITVHNQFVAEYSNWGKNYYFNG